MSQDIQALNAQAQQAAQQVRAVAAEMARVIVGQGGLVERMLIGLLCNGHVLLEGVPGLAKTLTVKTLAQTVGLKFNRIQFTPDLLPADLIGTLIYNPQNGTFTPKRGPIFANLILADEINRAPAKVQSALLEAMQEHQVTIGDHTYPLEEPFLVMATQNPIDQEGTYALPEAQVDRFMLKVMVSYPSKEEERAILERMTQSSPDLTVKKVMSPPELLAARAVVDAVYVDVKIRAYILDLVRATRDPSAYGLDLKHLIQFGASPRAAIAMGMAAKAHACLQGRGYVVPQDVKSIGMDVLRHRIIPSYEAEAESLTAEDIGRRIFEHIPVP
jgi:MoxR-like ATPase